MLQQIREQTQGWIAGLIVVIIIISVGIWGIHNYFTGSGINNVAATVNGNEISHRELSNAYENLRRQVQNQNPTKTNFTDQENYLIKQKALQSLIEMHVLKQNAQKLNLRISESQLEKFLQTMPEFQVNNEFSLTRFKEILQSSHLSTGDFLKLLKSSLQINQTKAAVIASAFVLPAEAQHEIELINQKRSIRYLTLPRQANTPIADKEIQDYYNSHHDLFMTEGKAQLEYLLVSQKDFISKSFPSDDTLKSIYNENNSAYQTPRQFKFALIEIPSAMVPQKSEQIEKVLLDLKSKTDKDSLETLAKSLNGHLSFNADWVPANEIPIDLQKSFSQLTLVGQVTPPIKTEKGLVIIKLLELQDSKPQPFSAVRDKILANYAKREAEEKFIEVKDKLADLVYEQPDSLQYAADNLKLSIKQTDYFSRDTPGEGILQYAKVRELAFNNDILNSHNNSDVIPLNAEEIAVIRIKNHVPAKLRPLSEVRNSIKNTLENVQIEKNTELLAQTLTKELNEYTTSADTLASKFKSTWLKSDAIERFNTTLPAAVTNLAFKLPIAKNKHLSYGFVKSKDDFVIVELTAIVPGSSTDKRSEMFIKQLELSEGALEYELQTQSLLNNAKIDIEKT